MCKIMAMIKQEMKQNLAKFNFVGTNVKNFKEVCSISIFYYLFSQPKYFHLPLPSISTLMNKEGSLSKYLRYLSTRAAKNRKSLP